MSQTYSPAELASRYGCGERRLRSVAREHGLCRIIGRSMFFTDADREALEDVLKCPSNSTIVTASGGYAGRSRADASMQARALLTSGSRNGSVPNGKLPSGKVISMAPRRS